MNIILLRNGRVIDPANGIDTICDVLVKNGRIAAVGKSRDPASLSPAVLSKTIDATGMWVVPGLVDIHAHFREPGFEHKETIATGSRAAAAGGFTTVCVMANTSPAVDNAEMVEFIKHKAEETAVINVLPVGAVTVGLGGKQLTDMAAMKAAGAVAFSDDGAYITNDAVMEAALAECKRLGVPLLAHCEDFQFTGNKTEFAAVSRDIQLAVAAGAGLHICHVSTAQSVALIYAAKRWGVQVTAEVTPHHFLLSQDDIWPGDTNAKMAPPIRSTADVLSIREALLDGTINVIATDHAPHSVEEKAAQYDSAPNGIIGLETAVPIALELVRGGLLTPSELIAKMTINPAKVIGIDKGSLSVGAEADITIIDPKPEYQIDVSKSASKSRNSPFNGRQVKGAAVCTICGGEVVYKKL